MVNLLHAYLTYADKCTSDEVYGCDTEHFYVRYQLMSAVKHAVTVITVCSQVLYNTGVKTHFALNYTLNCPQMHQKKKKKEIKTNRWRGYLIAC